MPLASFTEEDGALSASSSDTEEEHPQPAGTGWIKGRAVCPKGHTMLLYEVDIEMGESGYACDKCEEAFPLGARDHGV